MPTNKQLEQRIAQLEKLVVIMCAERGEFVEVSDAIYRHNFQKRMREILSLLPSLNDSMKND